MNNLATVPNTPTVTHGPIDVTGGPRGRSTGHRLAEELVLGPDSPVDGTGRESRLGHDVEDAGPAVALLGEDPGRSVEQALS